MPIHIDKSIGKMVISDSVSGRIIQVEWRCYSCGFWVNDEDAVWIDPNTTKASTLAGARPFHVECAPEQK